MIDFIKNVNKDAKVTIGLTIAEITFKLVDVNDYGYDIGRKALDSCWKWLKGESIEADDLCDYIDNLDGDVDISGIAYSIKDMKYKHTWYVLFYAIAYTSWMAYMSENGRPPEELDNVNDETLVHLLDNAIESKFFKIESIDTVKKYLVKNYPIASASENNTIIKEEIMKMVDNNY